MASRLLGFILLPFSLIYLIITSVRNVLYNKGYFKSAKFDIKTIGVGNLRVGGTGKTPHVEYLIDLLNRRFTIATLSRGYGRTTKGFLLANSSSNAENLGDEPMQLYSKYGKLVTVTVGEKRALAIPQIQQSKPNVNLILLDDVFQHRAVSPSVNILLSEYKKPFYKDWVMPSGRLRESRRGAQRADVVIVTKCSDTISTSEMSQVETNVRKYTNANTPIFFTGIKYKEPQSVFEEENQKIGNKVILVSGIANADGLEKKVSDQYKLIKHYNYSDHYNYTLQSLEEILKQFHETGGNDKSILLTEKDMVKWRNPEFKHLLNGISVFYLPVEIYFLKDKAKFDELILQKVEKKD